MNLLDRLYNKHKAIQTRFQSLKVSSYSDAQQHRFVSAMMPIKMRSCSQIENFYHYVIVQDLILQYPIRGNMELPFVPKVVLNTTSKRFAINRRELTTGLAALLFISGQRGQPTIAYKSVAAFKLRQGTPLGCKVTLRGNRGYSMLDKLITFVLPRGHLSRVKETIDTAGNWGVGISDPLLFVELEGQYELFRSLEGIDVSIVLDKGRKSIALLVASSLQLLV